MLRTVPHFGIHCTSCLQGECVVVRHVWKPYTGQLVGGKWDMIVLISEAYEPAFPLPALYQASRYVQPPHNHPEDGNGIVWQTLANSRHSM
jgi:hypothetical protein